MNYYIITYGCQMNKSDSERIAYQLEEEGYRPVPNMDQADLVIINACSIRQSAVNRVYSQVKTISKLKKKNPKLKIILTGCLLAKDKKQLFPQVNDIWQQPTLNIKAKRSSQTEAFVPIMTGCNNFCSYCVVPYTRGREYSRSAKEIIAEIKDLAKNNYQEITLLGQNVNSYQAGAKMDFPKLLKRIIDLPGNFKIKFLTSHPKDMSDELIKLIAQSDRIAKEIHLPVQSGSNQILKRMNRGYTVSNYRNLIKKIRQQIPQIKISTDIIVGFPGESKKNFQETVKLAKEIGFSQIYVAAYSPRFGTAAFKIKDDVHSDEKKRRKKIIMSLIIK